MTTLQFNILRVKVSGEEYYRTMRTLPQKTPQMRSFPRCRLKSSFLPRRIHECLSGNGVGPPSKHSEAICKIAPEAGKRR